LYNNGVKHEVIILLLENATVADSSQAFQSMYQYVADLPTKRYVDMAWQGKARQGKARQGCNLQFIISV